MIQILNNRVVLSILGKDNIKFINAISTNKIEPGKLIYSYFLNPQGRYLYDCFIFCNENQELYIDISEKIAVNFIEYLRKIKLRNDVIITDISQQYKVVYSIDILQNSLAETNQARENSFICSQQDPRNINLGYRSYIPLNSIKSYVELMDNLIAEHKYKYMIIDGCDDLIFEKSIPIEYLGEEQNAISFNKGCYTGQEVISRAKYQGVIRKKIYILKFQKDLNSSVKQGDEVLTSGGEKLGYITSTYQNKALAILRQEKVDRLSDYGNSVFIHVKNFHIISINNLILC